MSEASDSTHLNCRRNRPFSEEDIKARRDSRRDAFLAEVRVFGRKERKKGMDGWMWGLARLAQDRGIIALNTFLSGRLKLDSERS